MIEINLARQLQPSPEELKGSNPGFVWLGLVLCVGIGLVSWWWTQSQRQEYKDLLQQKHLHTQSFAEIQTTLGRLEKSQQEKQLLLDAVEALHLQQLVKKQPMALLDGVSRSVDGLEIWLDRVQMVNQVVELRGQSFVLKDIGIYMDALENHQMITSLPVLEIFDQEDREGEKGFSFMIRFTLGRQVNT
jgi:hypothetical protein